MEWVMKKDILLLTNPMLILKHQDLIALHSMNSPFMFSLGFILDIKFDVMEAVWKKMSY
jgi:hypothetical protein